MTNFGGAERVKVYFVRQANDPILAKLNDSEIADMVVGTMPRMPPGYKYFTHVTIDNDELCERLRWKYYTKKKSTWHRRPQYEY